ncbi:TPA: fimbrial protein [Serratia odorifera]|nr:fimbrial protein [Serratia odorifera]
MKLNFVTLFIKIGLAMAGVMSLHNANAGSCSLISPSSTITLSPIVVQRDVPIGTRIGSASLPSKLIYNSCDGVTTVEAFIGFKAYGTKVATAASGASLFSTNVPGISYSVEATIGTRTYAISSPDNTRNLYWIPASTYVATLNNGPIGFGVGIYKTGPTGTDVVAAKQIGAGIAKVDSAWQTEHGVFISSFKVTTLACALNTKNISVPLGDVLATKFTGVGATPVSKGFNVGLNCDANAKVNVSLSGSANADITNSDILALTNAGTAGVADGLGVQILYNGSPLKRDTNLLLKTSAGGVETFPFAARYYQTKSAVKPGKANATATLNLTYQ